MNIAPRHAFLLFLSLVFGLIGASLPFTTGVLIHSDSRSSAAIGMELFFASPLLALTSIVMLVLSVRSPLNTFVKTIAILSNLAGIAGSGFMAYGIIGMMTGYFPSW